jgi:Protein of unknown function (DUF3891)
MIRREITSPDGTKLWLLISQVEHASMSGELARHWREPFIPDVIEAIAHHDDGWAAWEAEPKLNPEIGAPFSFLEMPLPAALVIWDHSITAAAKFGPLASHIVAGHFYNLLSDSEQAGDPLAVAWLTAKRKQRTAWLDSWMRAEPSHTLAQAKQAQSMLLLADLFSLWLCCDCPAGSSQETILGQSNMKLRTETLLSQFAFSVAEFKLRHSSESERISGLEWNVAVSPFPFTIGPLSLSARALAAPARRYATWDDLQAAGWPLELEWRLNEALPSAGER